MTAGSNTYRPLPLSVLYCCPFWNSQTAQKRSPGRVKCLLSKSWVSPDWCWLGSTPCFEEADLVCVAADAKGKALSLPLSAEPAGFGRVRLPSADLCVQGIWPALCSTCSWKLERGKWLLASHFHRPRSRKEPWQENSKESLHGKLKMSLNKKVMMSM